MTRIAATRTECPAVLALLAAALLCISAATAAEGERLIAPAEFGESKTTLWSPTLEWTLKNPSHEGNPFDLVAKVAFTHESGDAKHVTEMFHAGEDTWKFRFTGTRTGKWTFTTQANGRNGTTRDPELHGRKGTVTVRPNPDPDAYGFVTNVGNKWARHQGNEGKIVTFVPHFRMSFAKKGLDPGSTQIDSALDMAMRDEGFNGVFRFMAGWWVDAGAKGARFADRDPDPRAFETLEELILKTHARGGVVHIWYCGDLGRKQAPQSAFGDNGAETKGERRLLRHIAARLGPLPGWIMGYGYDNPEHVTTGELRSWGKYLRDHMGWKHYLGARDQGGNINYTSWPEADFYSRGHWFRGAPCEDMVKAVRSDREKPHSFDERWWIKRLESEENLRRQLWLCNMAGGVSSIIGNQGSRSADPFSNPHGFKTFSRFWEGRFLGGMTHDNGISDGYGLRTEDRATYIFYKQDTSSVQMDLSGMPGPQPAVAVDTKKKYREIDIGPLKAGKQTWKAPYKSDWAIAVGKSFEPAKP